MDFSISFIVSMGVAVLGLYWWYYSHKANKYYKNIPTPPKVPFFGHALEFKSTKDVLPKLMKFTKNHGSLLYVQFGPTRRSMIIADYKMLEFILSSNKILTKSDDYDFLKSWLGSGLLIGSGPKWKKHRKILTPAFHFNILEHFIETFESCGKILIEKFSEEAGKNSVDVFPFVTMCTLDIICQSILGLNIDAQNNLDSEYAHSVKEMCRIIIERSFSPLQMNDWTFMLSKNYRIERRAVRILHKKSNGVIEKRMKEFQDNIKEKNVSSKKVFLDLLLEARVDGHPLSASDIREEVDTFMFAGHDTTATAISFALFCLANHAHVQQLVFEEQRSIFEDDDNTPVTYAHLQSMKYLELVIKETLRIYPSVPIIMRRPDEDLYYENTCIPKGDSLTLFIFGIHRDPKYFKDPEVFDPSRFENPNNKFPYAYLPFSAGPRNCIGQKFAMLAMKSVISRIIRKFELQPAIPQHNLDLVAETVLKSLNGIKIRFKLRE